MFLYNKDFIKRSMCFKDITMLHYRATNSALEKNRTAYRKTFCSMSWMEREYFVTNRM